MKRPRQAYSMGVMLLWKLLAILAVLAMPVGMTAAPAATHHQPSAAAMPMQHCPDQGGKADLMGGVPECAMACSAALPAADLAPHQPVLMICAPVDTAAAHTLDGLHPEAATPPPRRS